MRIKKKADGMYINRSPKIVPMRMNALLTIPYEIASASRQKKTAHRRVTGPDRRENPTDSATGADEDIRLVPIHRPSDHAGAIVERKSCWRDKQRNVAAEQRQRHQNPVRAFAADQRIHRPIEKCSIPFEAEQPLAKDQIRRGDQAK